MGLCGLEVAFNLRVTQFKASPLAPASPNHNRQSRSELSHFKQPFLLVSPQRCRLLLQSQPITKSGNLHSVPSSSPLAAQEVHPPHSLRSSKADKTGIGAAIATAFVKYSPKDAPNSPHVIIVGRSRDGANTVIEEMTSLNPAGKYEFVQGDLSLMSSVRAVAKEVGSKVDKVNFLVLTAGMLGLGKNDTSEGNDMKLSLDFYSRYDSHGRSVD